MPTRFQTAFPIRILYRVGHGDGLNYIRNSVKVVVDMYDGDGVVLRHGSSGSRAGGLSACISWCFQGLE